MSQQLQLFEAQRLNFSIETAPLISEQLALHAPVLIGVSGGKDSTAAAVATCRYLDEIGHKGERVLIHADLGSVEWRQSHTICQQVADLLGVELVTVRRKKGDMMARWQQRWNDNLIRYARLECVKLILPWSTIIMRFCTSEMKVAEILKYAAKRWPNQSVINVTGIRREESDERKNAPVCAINKKLSNPDIGLYSYDYKPIVKWERAEVFMYHKLFCLPLHEAYTVHGSTRVSCVFCVLGSQSDHKAAASCNDNQPVLLQQVDLEIESAFSFQERWLGDLRPDLLSEAQKAGLAKAKTIAIQRAAIEARIPQHLLYEKGWPNVMPTYEEAQLLASVRSQVAALQGIQVGFTDADNILDRYAQLIQLKQIREVNAAKKKARKEAKQKANEKALA
ncbi:phosphoadenosine phosphosulfate reductase domain-containing protein [Fibrella forsythiae]|uniref:Phosphoadenosine phosphosulfate reductase family protein n=1 Tax=Fibrella forsythiae TaxID=2817061 RepID=A0ABS3JBG1_9BACT|nr:phosphoadenosine phosphosulfate reductase family protein [Fibrella forsythiae]MBO0947333.1 phosphoadenosine phosphosulfate reductase family protein [Fibrella forsythiae]